MVKAIKQYMVVNLIQVTLSNTEQIIMTPGHPILTTNG